MTEEQQRIAIAEACGYTHVRIFRCIEGPPDGGCGHHPTEPHFVPDYLNDLNAMHEAEKVLDDQQDHIMNDTLWDMGKGRKYLWHATAAQRAEAFLRTIGKWEESK